MYLFLVVANALVISMLVIPGMLRLAPRLGMLDDPNEARKVHSVPMARVGGWGIVVGALVPVALWCPWTPLVLCYAFGAVVLLLAGALDDALTINHWYKFAAQFFAVIPLVYIGDLYVSGLPLLNFELPAWIGKPFTVIAIVGVVNALNHSDGLDGLAGGEALLSLIALTLLAWMYVGDATPEANVGYAYLLIVIASAVVGGVLGFLRFNTHPARVFMGDTGSQFLGYSLGFLVVLLTQKIDSGLSAAAPALLLGLPVADILAVLFLRYKNKMHLFLGSRNHVHHRLLDRGFTHYESVVVIYLVQALLVTAGVLLCYYSDVAVIAVYGCIITLLFGALTYSERRNLKFHPAGERSRFDDLVDGGDSDGLLATGPLWFLSVCIPAYLVGGAIIVSAVPTDFGVVSATLLVMLLLALVFGKLGNAVVMRLAVYAAAMFVVYLVFTDAQALPDALRTADGVFFVLLALAVGFTIRYARSGDFSATPMDYLVALAVLGVGALGFSREGGETIGTMVIKSIVMLYACELLLVQRTNRWGPLSIAAVVVLGCVSVRGLLSI